MDNSPERKEARAAYGAGVTAIHNIILQRDAMVAALRGIAEFSSDKCARDEARAALAKVDA